jgi:hypothetical protein
MEEKQSLWFQNVLLLGMVALLATLYVLLPDRKAHAAGGGWETDGVLCVSATGDERILLIDTQKKTMCVYRTRGLGEFRLVGARNFKYDVEIDDTSGSKDVEYKGASYLEIKSIYENSKK